MGLADRLSRLERQTGANRPRWQPPWAEVAPGEDREAEIAAIERQALAAGWQPERGPCVIVVHVPEGVEM